MTKYRDKVTYNIDKPLDLNRIRQNPDIGKPNLQ